jgi:hypothetical protein
MAPSSSIKCSQRCLLWLVAILSVFMNIAIVFRHYHIDTWWENPYHHATTPAITVVYESSSVPPAKFRESHQTSVGHPTATPDSIIKPSPTSTSRSTGSRNYAHNIESLSLVNMTWDRFVGSPFIPTRSTTDSSSTSEMELYISSNYIVCPASTVIALKQPRLSDDEFKWCKWCVSGDGGKVVVGKSWGKLTPNSIS